ncbi:MAG: preprotein translocase subunit SecE [Armatimonadetes bacterium]|nr:preprotein translocase subunit SecE [Armatimonadota bacterium]
MRLELTKVKWPSLADTWNLTLVVVFTIVGVGCYVALLDVVVGWLFKLFGLYHS